jgi:TP901 family phage tail tape measure protein
MNKSFADTMRSTGQFSTHFVSLSSDVEKFGKNLDRGRLKLSEYYNAWNSHTRKSGNLIKDLAKQQVMLENAIVQPVGKNAQGLMQYNVMVAKGLDEVKHKMALARQEAAIMNKVMLDGSNQLINWGKNTQWAGRQLTVGLTVPLVAFGAAAQKAFREADQELVRLTKVYGGLAATSSADLAQVRKDVANTAKEIAGAYGIAYKDTIALAADLAATGQQGNQLLESTQQTTRLAVLGEVDRQEAMKATLSIQNAFKQNTEELAQSIDFLNAVENQTSTSLADLVEAIPKAGPVVKSLGGDVKDLALYLTAMKEGGVNAAEGANAIKSAMASLINPTKVATEQFASFGIDLPGIVSKNAGNLTDTIMALQSALDNLDPLSKSRAIEQLFGKFQFARMSALFDNLGKSGSQTLQVMDLMKASATDLANISSRELKMLTESASGQFKRAWASVQADLAQVGEQFLKISTKILNVVSKIIEFFQNLPKPIKTFLNAIGGLTAIAGPLIMMAGVMGNFIGYVVKGIFHLRQLAKGGSAFKLLTPEIIAAEAAASGLATTFYSDSEATIVLSNAVNTLAQSFATLETKANAAKVAAGPAITTVAGSVISAGNPGGRMVDKDNPLIGKPHSRDMQHLIPSQTPQMGTIFGTVPGARPVNVRVGKNPQAYMNEDLPKIPGVTSVNSTSTGIVAQEAAKWHAMTAAIAMQSEAEIKALKTEVMATGTVTSSLTDSYQALLPQFSQITDLAAAEVKAIVVEVQQNKINVDQARAKIIQLNATVEAMLAETTAMTAATMGRTANLTTVPLTSQPVVDPVTGKSNMKEMFHKGTTKEIADRIARALGGVRTSGAGYNIQTTKPKFAKGGYVPGTGNTDTYHTTAEAGSFVINKKSTQENKPFIDSLLGGSSYYAAKGGQVPVVLTPGEAVIPASIAQDNMPLMYSLNGGPGNTSGMGRVKGGGVGGRPMTKAQYKKALRDYYNFISDANYEANIKARFIMLDAAEFMDQQPGLKTKDAITLATSNWREASVYHQDPEKWLATRANQIRAFDASQGPTKPLSLNINAGDQKNAGADTGVNRHLNKVRAAMLNMKEFEEAHADIKKIPKLSRKLASKKGFMLEGLVRGHGFRRGTVPLATRGFAGFAGIMPAGFNDIAAKLQAKNLQPDRIHFTQAGAIADFEGMIKNSGLHGFGTIDDLAAALEHDTRFKMAGATPSKPATPHQKDFLSKFLMTVEQGVRWVEKPKGHWVPAKAKLANKGGMIPGAPAQRLFGGGGVKFLGMPRAIKQVEQQRALKKAMEDANAAVGNSRFAKKTVTNYGELLEPTSGRSFPVPGIGGVYSKNGDRVFVKPVLDEKAALAEVRATQIAREVHGLKAPEQKIVVMRDPSDPKGARKILALESKYDPSFAEQDGKFTTDQYFKQLVASALRGDKDLAKGNLSGNILADVGPAGVFGAASGLRDYSKTMPSMKDQAMVNLLGVKGGGAKKFFAESTLDIPKGMTSEEYHSRMIKEIEDALPKLKTTVASFGLNAEEKIIYNAMIQRLADARRVNWAELHGVHSNVQVSQKRPMTPAAIAKMLEADELKRRQRGGAASLSDNAFKNDANGFAIGGLIGNVLKGKAMHRIGAGFGPTGAPKPSMYESAPWGVNSLSIDMADKLFASSGLRKHTQKLLYDKFAAALAQEKPYGYVKMPDGTLKNGLEPDSLDAVIRLAASNMISDRAVAKQLSPIDKDILRKKFMNWESKKDTPMTEALKKLIFSIEPREMGGPVSSNKPYLVGEKGPEIFVPRNAGGIIPNKSTMAQGYNAGGMIKMMLMSMLGMQGGMTLGKMSGIPGGEMIGSMLGSMLGMGSMGGGAAKLMTEKGKYTAPIGATAPGARVPFADGFKQTKNLTEYGTKLEKLSSSTNMFAKFGGYALKSVTRLNLAIGAGALALAIANRRWNDHKEHLRVGMLQYGLTEEAAKKAGLKFTDYSSKLADTAASITALREKNQLLYESMQKAGTPIKMTIEEYKKLRKEVKTVYADQIKLINQTKGEGNTKKLAEDLKVQLMAAGMSAEDATKKIWAMFKMSNKALTASAYTLQNSRFNSIETKQDAAARAVGGYGAAAREGGKEGANQVNTGLTAIDTGIQDLIDKSKAANKKDSSKPILTEYEAQMQMMDRLTKLDSSRVKLTAQTKAEMIKQNPALKSVLNSSETMLSLWQKMNLAAKGFTGNLGDLGSEAVSTLSKIADVSLATIAKENENGLLKDQYAELGRLEGQYKKLQKAAKGQSVAQQISTRDQLKALQKQIDANNKLADSRLKALDAAKQESDLANQIAKKKAEYEAALARGDTATAQQAGLDVKQLESTMQYNSQRKSIEDSRDRINAKLQLKVDAINDANTKMQDNAAYAAEGLSKLGDRIAKQKQKIEDFNRAMNTLVLNAIAAGKTVEEYIRTSKAGKGDAADLVNTGKAAGVLKGDLKGVDVGTEALKLMNGPVDAITSALSSKGITMGSGDIIINGKKVDLGGDKPIAPKTVTKDGPKGPIKTVDPTTTKPPVFATLKEAQAAASDKTRNTFTSSDGSKWVLTSTPKSGVKWSSGNWSIPAVKAGYGTMKLDPMVPTIVGDRGPEMAFGGMIIPNMAKLPFSSPRYDVNQAAKIFEPMATSSSGSVINLTQNIYPSDGMNTDAFVRQVVSMTKQAIGQDAKLNAKMVGTTKNVSIKS